MGKIATVAVYVTDQDAAVEFWTRQVGFEVRRRASMGPAGAWIEVSPAGGASRLVLYPKSMMPDWAERRPSIVFECDDVRATFEELSRRGVPFEQEPKEMAWGPFAIFNDSEGNSFGLRGPTQ